MESINLVKKGLIISATVLLIACGGGSSSSSDGPAYSGETGTAKITADNAAELTGAAIGGAGPASGSASLSGEAQTSQEKKKIAGFARGLRGAARSASRDFQGGSSSQTAKTVPADETAVGECGGEAVITGTKDDEVFDIDVIISFNNYCDDGGTYNGVVGLKGKDDDVNFDVTITFTNLQYLSKTESLTINGVIASTGTDTSFSVSMTYDFRDNNAGKTYRVENLAININDYPDAGYIKGTISGKVYHPDYGSFVITTDPELLIYDADGYPTAGAVKISGSGDTYAEATYYSEGYYILVIFDGEATITKKCDSVTDECTVQ